MNSIAEMPGSHQLLVSIVIPSFNHGRFIGAAIESVLSQDYPYIECIVVDGGSRDNTVEVLKSYGDCIRWISEPDQGESDAINKGVGMMKGQVYSRINSDDLLEPGAVGYVVRYFEQHPEVDMIYGECLDVDIEGKIVAQRNQNALNPFDFRAYVRHIKGCIPTPTVFMRRHVIDTVGGQDLTLHHAADHDLWLRVAKAGFEICYVPQALARYRFHDTNLTKVYRWRFLWEGLQVSARYGNPIDVFVFGFWLLVRVARAALRKVSKRIQACLKR